MVAIFADMKSNVTDCDFINNNTFTQGGAILNGDGSAISVYNFDGDIEEFSNIETCGVLNSIYTDILYNSNGFYNNISPFPFTHNGILYSSCSTITSAPINPPAYSIFEYHITSHHKIKI